MLSRRGFMKNGMLALVGTSSIPGFMVRSVMAEQSRARVSHKQLVVIFQRGAADGLNMVVPYQEKNYYTMRPSIAIQAKQVIDLDGQFGLHPALAAFKPLYDQGHLAIVHAVGSPDATRSHFDAQDYMESGTPGIKSTSDGWLNRALRTEHVDPKQMTAFRAVAMGSNLPRTLQGTTPAMALSNLQDFAVNRNAQSPSSASSSFEQMYAGTGDTILNAEGKSTFDAMSMLKATDPGHYHPANGVTYPGTSFANNLKQIAQLLKANLGVEAAFTDIGDWDTHQAQGAAEGHLANRLTEFSQAIASFWQDMGQQAENVTLVTMSEFGRTARQNGTGGTDHGHGNVMFVLSGHVKGGKVHGRWPGLDDAQLNEGRDLAVTTDFRQVLYEATQTALRTGSVAEVFPNSPNFEDRVLHFA